MPELLTDHPIVLDVVLLPTAWLIAALLASRMLRRRPARAHGAIIAGMFAAALTPLLSAAFRGCGWGLLAARRVTDDPQLVPPAIPEDLVNHTGSISGAVVGFAMLWLFGSLVMLARLLVAARRSGRLLAGAIPVHDSAWRRIVADAARQMNVTTPPRLVASSAVSCPVIWCWSRRPIIVMPPELLESDPVLLRGVVCHELAHHRRRDHLWALLADLVVCALPWHPLTWMARRRLAAAAEQACDAWALSCGELPASFARSLLRLLPGRNVDLAMAAITTQRGLPQRIERILRGGPGQPGAGPAWIAALIIVAAAAATTSALAHRAAPDAIASTAVPLPVHLEVSARNDVVAVPGELDLGVAAPGENRRDVVWLVNTSNGDRRIASAKASCGCTAIATEFPAVLAAGAAMPVTITMEASKQSGERKTKHVTFSIEGQPPLKLPVRLTTTGS